MSIESDSHLTDRESGPETVLLLMIETEKSPEGPVANSSGMVPRGVSSTTL